MARVLSFVLLLLVLPTPAFAQAWEKLFTKENITVWQREVPGTSFVEFRGRGIVDAPIRQIAAVLKDNSRKTEWMHSCVENRAVRFLKTGRSIVYNRTGSPFFMISDRDVVLRAKASVLENERAVHIQFENTVDKAAPELDGVVRMPRLKGYWKLRYTGEKTTEVTYQVQADPGGLLPAWLVNMVSKDIPLHTINNLRAQAKKPGYEKDYSIVSASFDWSRIEKPTGAGGQSPPKTAP